MYTYQVIAKAHRFVLIRRRVSSRHGRGRVRKLLCVLCSAVVSLCVPLVCPLLSGWVLNFPAAPCSRFPVSAAPPGRKRTRGTVPSPNVFFCAASKSFRGGKAATSRGIPRVLYARWQEKKQHPRRGNRCPYYSGNANSAGMRTPTKKTSATSALLRGRLVPPLGKPAELVCIDTPRGNTATSS